MWWPRTFIDWIKSSILLSMVVNWAFDDAETERIGVFIPPPKSLVNRIGVYIDKIFLIDNVNIDKICLYKNLGCSKNKGSKYFIGYKVMKKDFLCVSRFLKAVDMWKILTKLDDLFLSKEMIRNRRVVSRFYSGISNHGVVCVKGCPWYGDKECFNCCVCVFSSRLNLREMRP